MRCAYCEDDATTAVVRRDFLGSPTENYCSACVGQVEHEIRYSDRYRGNYESDIIMRHYKSPGASNFATIYGVEIGRYRGRVVQVYPMTRKHPGGVAHVKLDGYDKTLVIVSTQNLWQKGRTQHFSHLAEGQEISLEIVTRSPKTLGVDLFRGVSFLILPGVKS